MSQREVCTEIPTNIQVRYSNLYVPLFISYECALLETNHQGFYSYRAASIRTGKMEFLFQKENQLSIKDYEFVAQKIRKLAIAGHGMYEAEAKIGSKISVEQLEDILSCIFQKYLPMSGYSVRAPQFNLAKKMLSSLACRRIFISEAGVGTGKTHAYLVAAALAKRARINDFDIKGCYPGISYVASMPIVVATSSIALQQSIISDYLPQISDIMLKYGIIHSPLTAILRKGKDHYICEKRLNAYHKNKHGDNDTMKNIIQTIINNPSLFDLDEQTDLANNVKKGIRVNGSCDKFCAGYLKCRYMKFVRNSQNDSYDFQICNHNYLLADVLHRKDGLPVLIPHYQAIIIDEAHKFLPAAQQMFGVSLSSDTFKEITRDVRNLTLAQRQSNSELYSITNKLAEHNDHMFEQLVRSMENQNSDKEDGRFPLTPNNSLTSSIRILRATLASFIQILNSKKVLKKYESQYTNVMFISKQLHKKLNTIVDFQQWIFWMERKSTSTHYATLLCAIPIDIGKILYDQIWSRKVPVVLTSGTLSSGDLYNPFAYQKMKLGLIHLPAQRLVENTQQSLFDFKRNVLLYISKSVPFPNVSNNEYITALTKEIKRLLYATYGHTVILFTSYYVMAKVRELLFQSTPPYPLFCMKKGDVSSIKKFRQSVNGVLLASGSFWEGIDMPGDILSSLIIVKLPFPMPDPINSYEQSHCSDINMFRQDILIPAMLVKLKQGIGRLLRLETDTGVISILDSRMNTSELYSTKVLSALPSCSVTKSIADVQAFIRDRKCPEYFEAVN